MEIESNKNNQGHLLPNETKCAIILYKSEGTMSDKEIRRKILLDFGRRLGSSTVQTLWKKYQETNSISNNWSKEGRPRLLNQDDQAMLIEAVKENCLNSVRSLKNDLDLSPSRETINRELLKKGV